MAKVIQIDGKAGRKARPAASGPLGPSHSRVECFECREFFYASKADTLSASKGPFPVFMCKRCVADVPLAQPRFYT